MTFVLLKYVHLLGMICYAAVLVHLLLSLAPRMPRAALARLSRVHVLGHIAILLILATGFGMWFGSVEASKGTEWYSKNMFLHLKVTLFVLVILAVAQPTIALKKLRRGDVDEVVDVPRSLRVVLALQLLAVLALPLLGVLITHGYGMLAAD